MLWLGLAILWFAYCVGVAPTWCFVYAALRKGGRGRLPAWALASGGATIWFIWLPRYRRQVGQHTWVDQLEQELHELTP